MFRTGFVTHLFLSEAEIIGLHDNSTPCGDLRGHWCLPSSHCLYYAISNAKEDAGLVLTIFQGDGAIKIGEKDELRLRLESLWKRHFPALAPTMG